jgi:hypothetical protein
MLPASSDQQQSCMPLMIIPHSIIRQKKLVIGNRKALSGSGPTTYLRDILANSLSELQREVEIENSVK